MAISSVQVAGNSAANTTSISKAFTSNVTSGNLLVIYAAKYSPSGDFFVVGDCTKSAGTATLGTITLDQELQFLDTFGNRIVVGIWSAPVTGTGSCTMQIGGALSGSYLIMGIQEISGADTSGTRVDGSNESSGNSGAPDSGNVTSTAGAMFAGVLGLDVGSSTTITHDGAFSLVYEEEDGSTHQTGSFIYRIVTSGTLDSASWSAPSTVPWAAGLVVYKATAGGAITVTVNQVTETDLAQAVTRRKIRTVGQISESDTAQAVTPVKTNSPPVIASSNTTNGTTLSGGVSLNMPSGIVAGNLLIAFASNDSTGGTNMGISGWTQLSHTQYTGNVVSFGIWAKIAVGGDTATLTGAAQDYAACVVRITGHGVSNIATDIKVGTPATGSSETPDPPSLDASTLRRWLWIASNGSDDDDNNASYAPTNYTPVAQVESAQSTSSTMVQVAYRITDAQTENPGTFALTSGQAEEWIAQTIAIPPVAVYLSATVGQVAETDTAQAVARIKSKGIAQVSETDTAQTVVRAARTIAVNQVTETDTAGAVFQGGVALFTATFETGDFSEWDASVTDGGDLSVTNGAALFGSYGLSALIDDLTTIYVYKQLAAYVTTGVVWFSI